MAEVCSRDLFLYGTPMLHLFSLPLVAAAAISKVTNAVSVVVSEPTAWICAPAPSPAQKTVGPQLLPLGPTCGMAL